MPINFFSEDIVFTLKNKIAIREWIKNTIHAEGFKTGEISFILCSDEYLLKINVEYLDHDTYTDIITFDNSEEQDVIAGDIFISLERIQENADKFKVLLQDELCRVIIHGILHLCGYADKTPNDKKLMTANENKYLALRTF
ncbi:rRNA maturation RNase YbeY [Olivibacter domesticus]|uniref:Endoribonuclease YbeY n=1 Tax=Olivibacter domesticus TaxID=407022 RepID=A0A1H7S754_OLID1|nr:rRNA maturation RNase YbeY [Olivibacter domesticus]SEL68323.1 rRNA maturation RNase YbeY [Olivibacter domesticus]